MKILALLKYGNKAASTRQRLLQYREHFFSQGIEVECAPLLDNDYLEKVYRGSRVPVLSLLKSYFSRAIKLTDVSRFDLIWVHCESFPYMPGLAERLPTISGKPVVYDFDDAIFHQYDAHPNPLVRRFLGRKLQPILRKASLCVCGNAYLKAYADRFSSHAEIVPTVLDTEVYRPRNSPRDASHPITVGWIGSPSTWRFMQPIVPMLQTVAEELDLVIRVVGAVDSNIKHPRFKFIEWSEAAEVSELQAMDVGIMPLPDQPWARGKCGYKLIQYMACGIPVIASPVGVNAALVEHGVNGFLAESVGEWEDHIRTLAGNAELRTAMGTRGRAKIIAEYSLQVHGPRLATMLREVVARPQMTNYVSSIRQHAIRRRHD